MHDLGRHYTASPVYPREAVFPDLVVYNEDGDPETAKYHLLATMLLNELQKQVQAVEVLKVEVREVELL